MANLENACGASLKDVSAFYWDHNEAFAQFGGPLCVLPRGLAMLMEHLAKDTDIRLSKKVSLNSTDAPLPCVCTSLCVFNKCIVLSAAFLDGTLVPTNTDIKRN